MGIERPLLIDIPGEWIGPRLVLRQLRDDDAQSLFDAIIESQEHIRRWMPWVDVYQTVEDAVEFVRRQTTHWSVSGDHNIAIFARAGGAFLGGTGFHLRSLAVPSFEVGYWLRQSAEG